MRERHAHRGLRRSGARTPRRPLSPGGVCNLGDPPLRTYRRCLELTCAGPALRLESGSITLGSLFVTREVGSSFGLHHEQAGLGGGTHCAPVRAFRAVRALAQVAIMVLLATRN